MCIGKNFFAETLCPCLAQCIVLIFWVDLWVEFKQTKLHVFFVLNWFNFLCCGKSGCFCVSLCAIYLMNKRFCLYILVAGRCCGMDRICWVSVLFLLHIFTNVYTGYTNFFSIIWRNKIKNWFMNFLRANWVLTQLYLSE